MNWFKSICIFTLADVRLIIVGLKNDSGRMLTRSQRTSYHRRSRKNTTLTYIMTEDILFLNRPFNNVAKAVRPSLGSSYSRAMMMKWYHFAAGLGWMAWKLEPINKRLKILEPKQFALNLKNFLFQSSNYLKSICPSSNEICQSFNQKV